MKVWWISKLIKKFLKMIEKQKLSRKNDGRGNEVGKDVALEILKPTWLVSWSICIFHIFNTLI